MINNSDLIQIIGPLALSVHAMRSDNLTCNLPVFTDLGIFHNAEAEFQLEGNVVCFTSIEARNRIIATYKFMQNRGELTSSDPKWLNIALELSRNEIGENDSVSGRLLAQVHENYDVFSIAANAIKSKSLQVFDVLRCIGAALPYLKYLPPDGILKLISVQHEETKNDLAGGMFYNRLGEKLAHLPEICREIHHLLRNNATEETINLYPIPFLALAKLYPAEALELVLEDTVSEKLLLKKSALWTLGRLYTMSLIESESQSTVSTILIEQMSSPVEEIRQVAIRTAVCTAHATDVFDEFLIKLGENEDQFTLCEIANAIYMNTSEMKSRCVFNDWLQLLRNLSPTHKGILQQLDFVLSQQLCDENQQQFVVSWLTDWAEINAEDIPRDKSIAEIFNSTSHELGNRVDLLSQLITNWLVADNRKLASAAAGLLSHLWISGFRNPVLNTQILDAMVQSDLLFLARRILGFVSSEEHLLSLTISLLKSHAAKHRTFGIAYALLVDEIGKDYPSSTIEALETAKEATSETELNNFFSNVIVAIKERTDALDVLPRLAELRPPSRVQRDFAKARDKQMRTSMEEAQKGSIMRQLCTEIPLKAGIGSFSFRDGVYGEPTYMQAISHSVSLPMREVFDSVGYNIHLFSMRIAKRENS